MKKPVKAKSWVEWRILGPRGQLWASSYTSRELAEYWCAEEERVIKTRVTVIE